MAYGNVKWENLGVTHTAEFKTVPEGDKVALYARVNSDDWELFCLNVDEINAAAVGGHLVRRIARDNGKW